MLVNNVYFAREERAPLQLRQRRQGGVFQHERLQLQPGRRRLDVREIHLGQLRPALTLYFVMIVFHGKLGMFFGTAKIRNFPQIRKEMRKFLGHTDLTDLTDLYSSDDTGDVYLTDRCSINAAPAQRKSVRSLRGKSVRSVRRKICEICTWEICEIFCRAKKTSVRSFASKKHL